MKHSRRAVILSIAAAGLSACAGGGASRPQTAPDVARAVPNPAFDAWVAAFKPRAAAKGISQGTLDSAFRDAGYLPTVIERDRNQTEFTRSLEDYLAIAASDERISKGRQNLGRHQATLSAIEAQYGVDAEVVTAVWGLESQYGERRGDIPVISSVSTLAFDGRRGAFFEQQLVAALEILQRGDTTPDRMTGSWAGAMGHTQFIPTSYQAYAVDFTGDGRRDIWSEDPSDSLASTAAYLQRSGWRQDQPWGVEVALPDGFNGALAGKANARSASAWSAMGVRTIDGGPVPDYGTTTILIPQGPRGPAFAVFRNFDAILRYNNAQNYAIGVGHLSDRLAGKPPLRTPFPPDAQGMTIDDRKELQRRLTARGYDTQGADGVIGRNTTEAISAYQAASGLPVTGEPSLALLQRLR
jgi:lytic murein transglycosylase